MRVAITSRIFEPEPSAASFRLGSLATALSKAGHDVEVLTVRPPASLRTRDEEKPYLVRRFPVARDRAGYVRGYLQYLSFDVPVFFRLLFGRRRELIVTEPPPTTGFFVRLASALRRTPYAYYAADIWSDASQQTTAPDLIVRLLRAVERSALRGARVVLSVSAEVTSRIEELGIDTPAETIGNGVDVSAFFRGLETHVTISGRDAPLFVYAGTASEWHGAEVFVDAMPAVLATHPNARLRFIGGGVEQGALRERAEQLGVSHALSFEQPISAERLAPVLRGSTAALASVRPASSYEFAFPTKLYSAAACGAPILYSGEGPTRDFVAQVVDGEPLGISVGADSREAADAMLRLAAAPSSISRRVRVSEWASQHVSLDAIAEYATERLERAVGAKK